MLAMTFSPAYGDQLTPLNVADVRVDGEIGRRIEVTVDNNLLALDADNDFLEPFRQRTAKGGYVGLGKLIDALVRFAAHTGDPRVLERKKHVVDTIIGLQEPDGYIGMFAPEARLWKLWDIHEMAYLVYALTMDHRFFGEEASLNAARKAADYIVDGWSAQPDSEPGGGEITVYMAVTGLEPALIALYQECGDDKYIDACTGLRKLPEWDAPIVLGRWGQIQGHAYAYMCRCIGQMRLNRIQPDPRLMEPTQRALDFMLRGDGLAVVGTCGQHECWHNTPGRRREPRRNLRHRLPRPHARRSHPHGRRSSVRRRHGTRHPQRPLRRPIARRTPNPLLRPPSKAPASTSKATPTAAPATTAASSPNCPA